MAKLDKSILHNIRGGIGEVVVAHWRGQPYVRSWPKKTDKPPSEKQLAHRMKIKLSSFFCYRDLLNRFLDKSFASVAGNKLGVNIAFSRVYNEGIKGEYPNFELDFANIAISQGKLEKPVVIAMQKQDSKISLEWEIKAENSEGIKGQMAAVVVYNVPSEKAEYYFNVEKRNMGKLLIDESHLQGETHVWLTFADEWGNMFSNSTYAGMILI